jgi:Fe-S oxidoreductase
MTVLSLIPGARPELIESSRCGMAGSFGYEAGHDEVSMQMAEAAHVARLLAEQLA